MSNYFDQLTDYEQSAEDYFDNYGGFEGANPEYHSYNPNALGRIDPLDRTYTIWVINSGNDPKQAVIFGAYQNAEQDPDIEVSVKESSHNEVKEESKSNPFKILGMKMRVSRTEQFDNILRIVHRRSSGFRQERMYQPRNATSPQNNDSLLIDDEHFEMDVTGHDSLRLEVLGNTHVSFTFTVKARANMGNLLKGRNVAEISMSPRTSGIPQIDLIRKRPPNVLGISEAPLNPTPRPLPPPNHSVRPPQNFVLTKRNRG